MDSLGFAASSSIIEIRLTGVSQRPENSIAPPLRLPMANGGSIGNGEAKRRRLGQGREDDEGRSQKTRER